MNIKKSVLEKMEEARSMSFRFPDNVYSVMDKAGKRAVCISIEWSKRQAQKNGWHIVAEYQDGQKIFDAYSK